MFARIFVLLALIAVAVAYRPGQMKMNMGQKFAKAMGIVSLGITLAGPAMPMPAMADGAVSASTVYRARLGYGSKIYDLGAAVEKGDFSAFESKKIANAFDLFISGSNALNSKIDKERKAEEKKILVQINEAVKSKDLNKLRAAYGEFVKVADLKPVYKPNELGQTDSSGYAPSYGTAREYIYQR